MNIPLPALIGVLAVTFIAFMAILLLSGRKSSNRDRMLNMIAHRAADPKEQDKSKEKSKSSDRRDIAKKLKTAENRAQANTRSLTSLIAQAGFETSNMRFWVYSVLFGTTCTGVIFPLSLSPLVKGLLIFSFYFGLPRMFLRWKGRRRQRAFLHDFANALEDMIRLLKAGMPITEAIAMVAREYSGPVGEEMQRVYDAQRLGTPLPEAVQRMMIRMPLPEVQMFATAVAIQVQTGSSLSEVLGNLSGVIRGRYSLKRKVQALSAEAKISAAIIGSIPFLLTGILYLVNRDYIMLLFTEKTGQMLLGGAIFWMLIGILMMRQMINFKV